MITVRTDRNSLDRVNNGKRFEVNASGALIILDSAYIPSHIRGYAAGQWRDVVVQDGSEDKQVDFINFTALHALLKDNEPLTLTSVEFSEFKRRSLLDYTLKANSGGQYSWQGHPITIGNPAYEAEIVARSRALNVTVTS